VKLRDLIADYVTFRQSMGQKFTSCGHLLQAFCNAVEARRTCRTSIASGSFPSSVVQ
jgi:hypothetical protein